MEAIGQLTAGVAHNFNNLLSIVLPNVELCRDAVPPDAKTYLDDIEHAALRASELVRQLMLAARREGSLAKVPCELVTVVERTLHICRSTFDRAIDIRCQLELREVMIQARPGEIEQVLLNICINARDALQQAGTKDPRITLRLENGAEGMVQISITDNGPGVAPEVRSHLFEPFFTTKGVGRGTGLGLATAYGILGDHGGRIACDSQLGGPTTFRIELPKLSRRVQRQSAPAQPTLAKGTETILVIDDEAMVRRALRGVLESGGFRVLEAADGQEGLDLLADTNSGIALVVLDRSMPRMSGEAFLQELNRTGNKLPVVLLTGDPGQEALTASAVMLKPPRAAPLLSTVRGLLDKLPVR
jgi:CheY-like chemotaxis protein